jgi:hypothetical protein
MAPFTGKVPMLRVALLILLTVGCSPAMRVTTLAPTKYPPKPPGHPIRIYREQRPRCAFEEVAAISAAPRLITHNSEVVADALRAKARELGGDAIIGFGIDSRVTGASPSVSGGVDLERVSVSNGTVIRFKSETCTE